MAKPVRRNPGLRGTAILYPIAADQARGGQRNQEPKRKGRAPTPHPLTDAIPQKNQTHLQSSFLRELRGSPLPSSTVSGCPHPGPFNLHYEGRFYVMGSITLTGSSPWGRGAVASWRWPGRRREPARSRTRSASRGQPHPDRRSALAHRPLASRVSRPRPATGSPPGRGEHGGR